MLSDIATLGICYEDPAFRPGIARLPADIEMDLHTRIQVIIILGPASYMDRPVSAFTGIKCTVWMVRRQDRRLRSY